MQSWASIPGLFAPNAQLQYLCIHLAFLFSVLLMPGCLKDLADPGGLDSSWRAERQVSLS